MVSAETMPNLAQFRARGIAARRAWNELPSATMTNHASMLTGLSSRSHGLLVDFELPGVIPQPTIMSILSERGRCSAFFATKSKLAYFSDKADCNTRRDILESADAVAAAIDEIRAAGADFVFLHLRDPDSAGHRHGWLSAPYLDAVADVDQRLGDLFATVEAHPEAPTTIIVTADHGGFDTNHFWNIPENRLIPWIAAGTAIPAGAELEDDVFVVDTMPTILTLLGETPPADVDGRVLLLRAAPGPGADSSPASVSAPVGLPCVLFAAPAFAIFCRPGTHPRRGAAGGATRFRRGKSSPRTIR